MDYLEVIATLVFLVGIVMIVVGGRSRGPAPSSARLANVERKLDVVMKHLGIADQLPQDPDVVQHLMQGQKIQAIKAYRERTGAGLAEAKDEVERIARERGL